MKKKNGYIPLLNLLICAMALGGCARYGQSAKILSESEAIIETETTEPTVFSEESSRESPLPGFYEYELQMPVSEDTTVTLTFHGEELSSGYGISQIDVKEGEVLLQTILPADLPDLKDSENADQRTDCIPVSVREATPMLQDMNFDGLTDLGLEVCASKTGTVCCFWLWDTASHQFLYSFQLPNPVADAENKRILSRYPDDAGNQVTDYYCYAEDKTFFWIGREVTSTDADGKEHVDSYLVQDGKLVPDFKVTPLSDVMYAQSDANVRSGSSTDYDTLGKLSRNEEVQITGRCENGWYQFLYQGKTAYVAGDNLGKTPVAPKQQETPKQSEPQQETPKQSEPQQETPKQQETPLQPEPQPASQDGPYYMDDYAWSVLAIVNEKRADAGLSALTMNETLISAAKVRAAETTQSFSHSRPDGSSCFTAFNVNYMTAGENIAAGQQSPEQVMNSWMNSAGHKANILNPDFTQIAIACYYVPGDAYGYYWVQLFIG